VKSLVLSLALVAAGMAVAPQAHAGMLLGNYELVTPRDPVHSWVWEIGCDSQCVHVNAIPRPGGGAVPWDGYATLVNGRYTMTVDRYAGLICPGYGQSTTDTWSWDAVTLSGSVDSSYPAGCWGAPGGTDTYPFTLSRL
jgi:hypothetical protein